MDRKILVVIPARKGSSFKGKNRYPLNGRPLIHYTFDAADIDFPHHDTLVSTDDHYIKADAEDRKFIIHHRPDHLADATSTLDQVMVEIATLMNDFEYFVCLAPTSPLRTKDHLNSALKKIIDEKGDSLTSVCEERKSIWRLKNDWNHFADPLILRLRNRQSEAPVYVANGAIFITKREILLKYKRRTAGRVSLFVMQQKDSVDIHNFDDIKLAEFYLNNHVEPT